MWASEEIAIYSYPATKKGRHNCQESTRDHAKNRSCKHGIDWFFLLISLISSGCMFLYCWMFFNSLARAILVFLVSLIVMLELRRHRAIFDFIIDHRIAIATTLCVLCISLSLSGSSISIWGDYLSNESRTGTVLGIPRMIRSDEWAVSTPFAFSQVETGRQAISPAIRGGDTNVTLISAGPAWSIGTFFRPFQWGYLFFDAAHGLSFFWCTRFFCSLLVTFQLSLLLSNNNRELSTFATILVVLSPIVQWWGAMELFVYGEGLVLTLNYLLHSRDAKQRWIYGATLAWLLGCYALTLYPAWQVPLVYVFGIMGICVIVRWARERKKIRKEKCASLSVACMGTDAFFWKEVNKSEKNLVNKNVCCPETQIQTSCPQAIRLSSIIVPLLVCVPVVFALIGIALYNVQDIVAVVNGTVYPGARFSTGGSYLTCLMPTAAILLSAIQQFSTAFYPNVCECSIFFGLFPLGVILAIWQAIRQHDFMLWSLLAIYVFLALFGIFGFPAWLARATFLCNVPSSRLTIATGYLDIMLLLRALALWNYSSPLSDTDNTVQNNSIIASGQCTTSSSNSVKNAAKSKTLSTLATVLIPILFTVGMDISVFVWYPDLISGRTLLFLSLTSYVFGLAIFAPCAYRYSDMHNVGFALIPCALIVFCIGITINPIQQGADALTESELYQNVQEITKSDQDALWMADGTIPADAVVATGAPTINTVNAYPNLDLWHTLDPNEKYEDVYNRYAHISVSISDNGQTNFQLLTPDSFLLEITPSDLEKIHVRYFVSSNNLSMHNTEQISFSPIANAGPNYTIYQIDSKLNAS